MSSFKSPETLGRHLSGRICSQDPGKRVAEKMEMPGRETATLHYRAGPSASFHPCVYADFETFNTKPPQLLSGQNVLAKQDRVASFAYMAVGRTGFQIPPEHRLRLERASQESGEFGIVECFLRCLLALAKEYREWRIRTNAPCRLTQEELQHHFYNVERCEICGVQFDDSDRNKRKVLHHEHGTGRFLAAACNTCNLGIRLPTSIPIYMHNGASFDFHYLLRFLAHEKGDERNEDYIASSEGLWNQRMIRAMLTRRRTTTPATIPGVATFPKSSWVLW